MFCTVCQHLTLPHYATPSTVLDQPWLTRVCHDSRSARVISARYHAPSVPREVNAPVILEPSTYQENGTTLAQLGKHGEALECIEMTVPETR